MRTASLGVAISPNHIDSFAEVRRRVTELDPATVGVLTTLEREVSFLELLQHVSFASNASSSIERPVQTCLDTVCRVVGWPIGHAWVRAPEAPELLVSAKLWHLPEDEKFDSFRRISESCRFEPGIGLPGRVLETGKPAWIEDVVRDPNFPRAKLAVDLGVHAGCAFPVLIEDEVHAVLEFFSSQPAKPDPELLELMAQVGTQLGRVFERKRNEQRLRLVSDVSNSLSESLDPTVSLERLAQPLVPVLADWCMVDVFEGNDLRAVAFAHRDSSKRALIAELAEIRTRVGAASALPGVDVVVQSGQAFFAPTIDAAWLAQMVENPDLLRILRELGPRSEISVPLEARGIRLGALTCVLSAPLRRYRTADLQLMTALARRASLAIDNARLYRNAQQAIRIREEIVAVVSHDLKNPLSVLLGNAQLLDRRLNRRDDVASRLVAGMLRAGNQMHRLIRDLLDIAIIDGGQLVVEKAPANAVQLAKEAVELHEPLALQKRQCIELNCEAGTVAISVDRDRFVQALSNLLGNAIKFSPHDSKITVDISNDDKVARISVSDQGSGIPLELVEDVFKRYWQANGASKRDGTGLGLFITRSIIEAHGGTVRVTATSNHGSTFTIVLPLGT